MIFHMHPAMIELLKNATGLMDSEQVISDHMLAKAIPLHTIPPGAITIIANDKLPKGMIVPDEMMKAATKAVADLQGDLL